MGRAGGDYVSLKPSQKAVLQGRGLSTEPSLVMVLAVFGRKVALEYGRDARLRTIDLLPKLLPPFSGFWTAV